MTKYHRLGGLKNRNLFSHSFGGWNSKTSVSAGFMSSEVSLLGSQMTTSLLCSHMVFSLYMHTPGVPLRVPIFSSYKDSGQIGLGPTL